MNLEFRHSFDAIETEWTRTAVSVKKRKKTKQNKKKRNSIMLKEHSLQWYDKFKFIYKHRLSNLLTVKIELNVRINVDWIVTFLIRNKQFIRMSTTTTATTTTILNKQTFHSFQNDKKLIRFIWLLYYMILLYEVLVCSLREFLSSIAAHNTGRTGGNGCCRSWISSMSKIQQKSLILDRNYERALTQLKLKKMNAFRYGITMKNAK